MRAFFNRLLCLIFGHDPFLFNDNAAWVSETNGGFRIWGPGPSFSLVSYLNQYDDVEIGVGYCNRCRDGIWVMRKHPKVLR